MERGRDVLIKEEMRAVATLKEKGKEGPYRPLDHILEGQLTLQCHLALRPIPLEP